MILDVDSARNYVVDPQWAGAAASLAPEQRLTGRRAQGGPVFGAGDAPGRVRPVDARTFLGMKSDGDDCTGGCS